MVILQPDIKGDTDALSTVTGIVDGTGSFGAAIGQVKYSSLYISPICSFFIGEFLS